MADPVIYLGEIWGQISELASEEVKDICINLCGKSSMISRELSPFHSGLKTHSGSELFAGARLQYLPQIKSWTILNTQNISVNYLKHSSLSSNTSFAT